MTAHNDGGPSGRLSGSAAEAGSSRPSEAVNVNRRSRSLSNGPTVAVTDAAPGIVTAAGSAAAASDGAGHGRTVNVDSRLTGAVGTETTAMTGYLPA
jgi:hypothetical protein